LGDYVCSQLVLVQANLTIATNATAKLDKRVIYTPTKTVLTTTGDSLYASGANTEARLAIGTTNQALTVVAGIPAWRASATSVLTTTADVLYASAANVLARLGIGSTGQALTVFGGLPAWRASATSALTTTGDVLYASAANTLARLGIGSTGQVITVAGGVPTWATPSASEWVKVSSATFTTSTSLNLSGLSGYKRYRLRFFIHSVYNNGGGYSSSIGAVTATINGLTDATYVANFIKNVGTTVTGTNTTNATSIALTGGQTVGANGQTTARGIFIQFTVELDTQGTYQPIYQWQANGASRNQTNDNFQIVGGGEYQNTTQVSSITAIALAWTNTVGATLEGSYLIEGSNS